MLDPINDRPLARRLFLALALPVALLLVVGVVLGLQISRMRDTARWVDQTDAVLAKVFEVQKRMLDQETGLRGYLITGDRVFLQPYETANVRDALHAGGSFGAALAADVLLGGAGACGLRRRRVCARAHPAGVPSRRLRRLALRLHRPLPSASCSVRASPGPAGGRPRWRT